MKRFRIPEIALGFLLATACFGIFELSQMQLAAQTKLETAAQQILGKCAREIAGVCFVTPSQSEQPIFGFAQFVTAFALLMLVYTVSDVRYRFRVAASPIPLIGLTYILSGLIGFGTLLNSIWFAEKWPIPRLFSSQPLWQATFAIIFFMLAMTWIWYAFISAPIFTKRNCVNFARALYSYILKGSESELPIIAGELARSADSIVRLASENPARHHRTEAAQGETTRRRPNPSDVARDVMLLIGNRKFCRHIVASSPITAIEFLKSMTDQRKYQLPLNQFAVNISSEALINKDSILYHEDQGYYSGLLGYIRPFSNAIYGDYYLVEALASNGNSPLDIDLNFRGGYGTANKLKPIHGRF